ncbi:DUF6878 family protein [Tropicibacter sp. S64]|uniref:DUF6878 family protein n=1 Tax=Tropicibacter sp. S64 TaxID=3415122 RepID=UPI003C7AFC14
MLPSEPTLVAPMPPSRVNFAALHAAERDREARRNRLLKTNKTRFFAALSSAGITHVVADFRETEGACDVHAVTAFAGPTVMSFPAAQIPYLAVTWDNPEIEPRILSLPEVAEQLVFDLLEDMPGIMGTLCFDATARCVHLDVQGEPGTQAP